MKMYRYYFDGLKPVSIEATSRESARAKLEEIMPELTSRGYDFQKLLKETCETLLEGVSTKKAGGKQLVWNGQNWSEQ